MNIRETISYAIDRHGEELRLSRRQLAEEAKVNAGQTSNWLRNDGAMHFDKQGKLADVLLSRIEEYLERHPNASNVRALNTFKASLTSFGPRLRRIGALPETALTGGPITRENPLYVHRASDIDLEDRLQSNVIRIGVSGGPKTGKSSLLWTAEELLEGGRTVVRVDFAHYQPSKPGVEVRELFKWIQMKCEEQVGGSHPEILESPTQLAGWATSNLLSNSLNGKCVMIFDHVGSLDPSLVDAFQEAITRLSLQSSMIPSLRRLGVMCAFDPFDKAFQGRSERGLVRPFRDLSLISTYPPLQFNHIDSITAAHGLLYVENPLRKQILEAAGGHPFVTQVLCKAVSDSGGNFAEALERGRAVLAEAVQSRWSADNLAFTTRACAPESEAFPINGHGVLDLIHSCIAKHEITPEGDVKFSPAVAGVL